jgi:hypothetical protein
MSSLNHVRSMRESRHFVAPTEKTTSTAFRRPDYTRKKGAQTLQNLLDGCLEPTLKAKGFADSAIHMHWSEIAGAALAPWSEPISLKWPPRLPGADPEKAKGGATLTIKVEGAFALDVQHLTPQIIQRVNGFFGWRCVEKLVLKQGPVRKDVKPERRGKPVLTVDASQKLDALLGPVDNPALKAALARLGVGVMGKRT